MTRAEKQNNVWMLAKTAVCLLAALGVWAVAAQADGEVPRRLERKINVMEKVINEVLRESPFWLVGGGGDYTRSIYLEPYGVIFAFDATLVDRGFGGLGWSTFDGIEWLENLDDIRIEQDGDKVIVYRDPDRRRDEDDDEEELSIEELRQRREERASERYEEGKEELIDVLMDYGDTLTELQDDHYVTIAVYLDDEDFFEDEDISRLLLSAKIKDLRNLTDGRVSRDELREKITVVEY